MASGGRGDTGTIATGGVVTPPSIPSMGATGGEASPYTNLPEHLNALGIFWLDEIDPPDSRGPLHFKASLTRAAIVTAGYGGWSRTARPKKKALTEWVGRDSVSVSIDFFLNDWDEQNGFFIEDMCRTLESMAGVDSGDPEPPLLEVHSRPAGIVPHSYERATHVQWFVESIDWDQDNIRYNNDGNRVVAIGTMVVTQYVKDERLHPAAERRNSHTSVKGNKGGRRKTYTVKKGDTLQKIAARKDVYHDARKWKKLAQANHIRDPSLGSEWWGKTIKIP